MKQFDNFREKTVFNYFYFTESGRHECTGEQWVKLPSYIARADPKVAKDGGQHHANAQGVRLGGERVTGERSRGAYIVRTMDTWRMSRTIKKERKEDQNSWEWWKRGKGFQTFLGGSREKFFQKVCEPLIQKML